MIRAARATLFAMLLVSGGAVTASQGGKQCDRRHPLVLPAGWIHVGAFHTDAPKIGVYHDRESGAFVRYSIQDSDHVPARRGDIQTEGILEGRRYRVWKGSAARERWAEEYLSLLRVLGQTELSAEYLERLPPGGSNSVIVVFDSALGSTAHGYNVFSAGTTTPEQEQRIDDLLIRRYRFNAEVSPCAFDGGWNILDPERIESLAMATHYDHVLKAIGPPNDALPWRTEGFIAVYGLKAGKQGYRSARLAFDKDQLLREKVIR